MSCQESELGPNQCSRTLYVAETLAVCVPEVLQRVTSNAAQEKSLTPWLTGAGSRRLEGTNISHEDAEGMAYVGVRVEPTVRLGSAVEDRVSLHRLILIGGCAHLGVDGAR